MAKIKTPRQYPDSHLLCLPLQGSFLSNAKNAKPAKVQQDFLRVLCVKFARFLSKCSQERHRLLFDVLENAVQLLLWHIEDRLVFRQRLLGHPFWNTVILGGKAGAAIEFPLHANGLLA